MYYLETRTLDRWAPQTSTDLPVIKNGRLSSGAKVRRDPVPVPDCLAHLTLQQLQEVLGPDGRFTKGQGNG